MIPKTFDILGIKVKVEYRKLLYKKEKAIGLWLPQENKILIQENVKECMVSQEQKEQIFFHELTHCILDKLGYAKLSADEKLVDTVGSCFHQVLKTMRY